MAHRYSNPDVQGEASFLSAPDTATPVEAIERPERFPVRKLRAEILVAARNIEWLEAADTALNYGPHIWMNWQSDEGVLRTWRQMGYFVARLTTSVFPE
jgi:hypothetical protein